MPCVIPTYFLFLKYQKISFKKKENFSICLQIIAYLKI